MLLMALPLMRKAVPLLALYVGVTAVAANVADGVAADADYVG